MWHRTKGSNCVAQGSSFKAQEVTEDSRGRAARHRRWRRTSRVLLPSTGLWGPSDGAKKMALEVQGLGCKEVMDDLLAQ